MTGISDLFKKSLRFDNLTNDDDKALKRISKGMKKGKDIQVSGPLSERETSYQDESGETKLEKMSASSTAIRDFKYDPKSQTLNIQFTSGDKYYAYPNVPPEEIENWLRAPSKGHYYNTDIKQYSVPSFRG